MSRASTNDLQLQNPCKCMTNSVDAIVSNTCSVSTISLYYVSCSLLFRASGTNILPPSGFGHRWGTPLAAIDDLVLRPKPVSSRDPGTMLFLAIPKCSFKISSMTRKLSRKHLYWVLAPVWWDGMILLGILLPSHSQGTWIARARLKPNFLIFAGQNRQNWSRPSWYLRMSQEYFRIMFRRPDFLNLIYDIWRYRTKLW